MPKTTTFTTITPLPAGIRRKSVLDMYKDHMAMIDLNPLVVERFKCKPPTYTPAEEYFAAWYTIKDKVSYLPGGLAQGSVSYHACFHDTPEGLQTHVYAPLGLDIRGKWSVGGSLPGEPKETAKKGVNTPRHGIYIREDVTMTCSSLLMGFVKRTFKDSHAALVEKLVEKAHLLESNFANERLRALRNVEPGERMAIGDIFIAPPPDYLSPPAPDFSAWGYRSPRPQSPYAPSPSPRFELQSAPTPTSIHRTNTLSPRYSPRAHSQHSRSHSDPITSPGFSSSSTLVSESDRPATPPKNDTPKSASFSQPSSSAPEPSLYLLPATTYGGGVSQNPITSNAGGGHVRKESNVSLIPPRISYTPEERPISFTFTNESPFDTRSHSESSLGPNHNLLDEIDDAIDQVFLYTLPSHSSPGNNSPVVRKLHTSTKDSLAVPAWDRRDTLAAIEYDFSRSNSVTTLPAAKFSAGETLPATIYEGDVAKTTLPATTYEADLAKTTLQSTKYDADVAKTTLSAAKYEPPKLTLPSTKYEPELKKSTTTTTTTSTTVTLPSTTYKPERARKDSAVPWHEKELPPVPVDG
ncbi:hypothetical protein HBI64_030910 [Parastagonospora nodorum]|nr:hypothetical protein HBI06_036330 [Parastagonospora nodorum]KAH4238874.1 hypothetical protein HBI05_119310 [Parastagonospora nodorum]KAH5050302.1 hypothetical protein HBH96_188070 [Parastagonospora nodorum]KAH6049541.1 hypothetical protein HBI54_054620 [Parastagonospora nodorum]KAH6140705.1 hypothetical protein HBI64_030910 [Parastagonospora nodorum]